MDSASSSKLRLVIADDHPLFRGALRAAIVGAFRSAEIEEAGSIETLVAELDRAPETDLILLDLAMPGVRGFSGLLLLRAQYPGIPVIVVSAHSEPEVVRRCMEFGASGFIPKTTEVEIMREAVRAIMDGGIWTPPDLAVDTIPDDATTALVRRLGTLTPQQVRVLMMLSGGLLNKQIAYELGVSEATVKAHVSAILQKLDVDSRTQAVIAASRIEAGQWLGATLAD
jgi:DNA-binding NarL/FixJ family response regulator